MHRAGIAALAPDQDGIRHVATGESFVALEAAFAEVPGWQSSCRIEHGYAAGCAHLLHGAQRGFVVIAHPTRGVDYSFLVRHFRSGLTVDHNGFQTFGAHHRPQPGATEEIVPIQGDAGEAHQALSARSDGCHAGGGSPVSWRTASGSRRPPAPTGERRHAAAQCRY